MKAPRGIARGTYKLGCVGCVMSASSDSSRSGRGMLRGIESTDSKSWLAEETICWPNAGWRSC